jgi:hypothetical protein
MARAKWLVCPVVFDLVICKHYHRNLLGSTRAYRTRSRVAIQPLTMTVSRSFHCDFHVRQEMIILSRSWPSSWASRHPISSIDRRLSDPAKVMALMPILLVKGNRLGALLMAVCSYVVSPHCTAIVWGLSSQTWSSGQEMGCVTWVSGEGLRCAPLWWSSYRPTSISMSHIRSH